jgi:hypothetical protein
VTLLLLRWRCRVGWWTAERFVDFLWRDFNIIQLYELWQRAKNNFSITVGREAVKIDGKLGKFLKFLLWTSRVNARILLKPEIFQLREVLQMEIVVRNLNLSGNSHQLFHVNLAENSSDFHQRFMKNSFDPQNQSRQ